MFNQSENQAFLNAASRLLNKRFTVDTLTTLYLAQEDCPHKAKKGARQFVYRRLKQMLKRGEIVRHSDQGKWPMYEIARPSNALMSSHQTPVSNAASQISQELSDRARENLQERMKVLRLEMLTAMGEVEEYSTLEAELPELNIVTCKLVEESRDRCSKLLGKVKAIETLLNH